MDKGIVKDIFLLTFEVIKALLGILWKTITNFFAVLWDRFFGMTDVSTETPPIQEWGVTGEDTWQDVPEVQPREETETTPKEEPQKAEEKKELVSVYIPSVPELPEGYGDNRIVLMIRDPIWLFTYWEIRKDVFDKVRNALGTLAHSAKMVLRVYDVTDIIFNGTNAHKYFDSEVSGSARSWYINVGEPNRSLCVDIGFLAPNGTFRILARSNTVRTPRVSVSEVVDEKWMSIEELYEKTFVLTGLGISGESVFERVHRNWQEIPKEGVLLGVSSAESSKISGAI